MFGLQRKMQRAFCASLEVGSEIKFCTIFRVLVKYQKRQCTFQFSCFNIRNICLLIAVSRGNVLFGFPWVVAKD